MRKIFTKGIYIVLVFILFLGATLPARAQFTATTLESGNLASAVAKDASGNIYVVQFNLASGSEGGNGTGELVKYTNGTGTPTVIYTGIPDEGDAGNDWATGLVVASNGDIYLITDNNDPHTQDGQIIKLHFNSGTSYTPSVWQTGTDTFGFYAALAIDSSDNIYAVLYNFNADGNANGIGAYEVVEYTANSAANSAPAAVLYQKLDESALSNEVNFDDGYAMTSGLAVAPNGDVYVTDAFNDDNSVSDAGRIWKLTKANGFAATIVSSNYNATGLAVDASGNLFSLQSTTTGVENGNYGLYEYPNGTATQSPTAIYTPLNAALTDLFPYGIAMVNNHDIFVTDGQTGTGVNKVLQLQNTTTITSINRVSSTPTNATSIQFTATFGAAITGLTTSNFSPATTGTASGTVSAISGSGTTYTVTVNSISGNGTIGLNLANATGLSPGISTTLPFAGQVYTIDNTAPTIGISAPSVSTIATGAGSVTYTVTYADANFSSSTLATGNISLNTTGNATGTIGVSGTGTTRTVTISGITGSGSIGISIVTGTASDLAGNSAPAAGPSTTFAVTLNPETITFAVLPTKTYGNADFAPGAISDNGGVAIEYSSDNAAVATIVSGIIHITGAGTANITASQAGDATHSAASNVIRQLTVNTSPLTITANDQSSIKGQALPTLTASYTGLVNGDTPASLTTPPTITTTGTPSSTPGPYPITASGAVDANYAISYVAGTLTITASSDATLSALSLSSGMLAPSFAPGTMSYSASVSNSTSSITVTPTTNDATATVTVNGATVTSGTASGPLALAIGDNVITTVVTAQDGTTMDTYTVTVTRPSNDALLSLFQVNTGTVLSHTPGPADENYTTSVGFATSSIIITPVAENANATITINGTPVASGTSSDPIALNAGPTTIDLSVTAQDGITVHTIELTVNRTGSSNAKLTVIQLSPGTVLTTTSGPDDENYAASVANSVSSVTITPTTADPNASVTVNGSPVISGTASNPIALNAGPNTISLVVTAQDGTTTRTFSVTVTRAGSNNDRLSSLQLSTGTVLSPTSGPGDENFTTSVDFATTSLTLTAIARDANASITVNSTPVASGSASNPIALNAGPTTITTIVTAQDGITTRSYIVTVNRTGSSNARLSLLQLNSGTIPLTQVTNSDYTATVDNSISTVTVTPTTADANATVTVNGTTVSSGTASDPIVISSGANTINLLVTAQDGSTTRAFTITVTQTGGPAPGFATYQSLSVNSLSDNPQLAAADGIIVHPGLSPNGDGINDYLLIEGLNAYPDNKLLIMNRSGIKVFEAQGYDNNNKVFNGHSNINGVMQQPGTYFYTLDYNNGTEIKHKTGYIIIKY